MIVLRTPEGWTGPESVDGEKGAGFWRSHEVPLSGIHVNSAHLQQLENRMKSYRPEDLFDAAARLVTELREISPRGIMGRNYAHRYGIDVPEERDWVWPY